MAPNTLKLPDFELPSLAVPDLELPEVGGHAQLLAELRVQPDAWAEGYDRDLFGQRWSDDVRVAGGHNGCDTRNDILRRDLNPAHVRPGTYGCLVEWGTLADPYTGAIIDFERGDGQVEIDHVVPLADAWAKGASQWDELTRRDFANDPRNLLAVSAEANRSKSASDAAEWQPPHADFACRYAQLQVEVKHAYGLAVTPGELAALTRGLASCLAPGDPATL
ncbi:HNH endonuclease family protein [Corynebacterium uterequi]|uniref:HNH endonuclease family protein n=1 Tax=Corynebacterium uterequi TaxID=1072256 RepID=UPI001F1BC20D|nr:HNH endonuclease family protein [Corynebacterium uterequi]